MPLYFFLFTNEKGALLSKAPAVLHQLTLAFN